MAMIYRHRPLLPALLAAVFSFIAGAMLFLHMEQRYLRGDGSSESVLLTGCITIVLTGSFLIMAFARYRFTHLWKSTGAAHSDKYKHPHKHRKHQMRSHR